MQFGNASWGFRETPLVEQLKITKEMGLNLLELGIANAPMDLPLDISDEEIKNVIALFNKYGINLTCAATGDDFTNSKAECDENVVKLNKVIDICAKLGVKYLRIFAGFSAVETVDEEKWQYMIKSLNEVGDYAAKMHVIPVIETHGGVNAYDDGVVHFHSTSTSLNTLKRMYAELGDNLYFNYDPANLYAVGYENPDEVYQVIKDKVVYVHLKDFVTLPSGHLKPASCGESDMDWKTILKSLQDFDGPALFEYENVEDVTEGCKRCLDYINKIKKEIN